MPSSRTLKEAIYGTIHRSKKNINQIADDVGLSTSSLYRYCMEEDTTSYAEFPLRRLLPIINSTNNDSILDYLEARRGRIALKVPKIAASKLDEEEMVDSYQKISIDTVQALRRFINKPDKNHYEMVNELLKMMMNESVSIKKYCTKKIAGQLELEL